MADPSSRIADALKPDGFIDFYQLLDAPKDATTTALRSRINELYSDAQANRDHRNINKRREYEMLLELLPHCRTVLLDEAKRGLYDQYAAKAAKGVASPDFETFMNQLIGAQDEAEERASLLGVKEQQAPKVAPPGKARRKKAPAASPAAIIFAVVAALLVFAIVKYGLGRPDGAAVVLALIIGAVVWVVVQGAGRKISR